MPSIVPIFLTWWCRPGPGHRYGGH